MITTPTLTDFVPADVYTRQSGTTSEPCPRGGKQMPREMQRKIGDIDFSRVNLQYLICARDLARVDPERTTVLLGVPDDLV